MYFRFAMNEAKKEILVNDHAVEFVSHNGGKHWRGNIKIGRLKLEIEIEPKLHEQNEVDWDHFEKFCNWLEADNQLELLAQDAKPAMLATAEAFFRSCLDEVSTWDVAFENSIIYKGYPNHQGNLYYSFSLVFSYGQQFTTGGFSDGDPYGLYLIDVESWQIVGTRRIQC